MAATADELKELALLAREMGDDDTELAALEQLDAMSASAILPAAGQPTESTRFDNFLSTTKNRAKLLAGIPEALTTIATGAVAEPIAGLSGMPAALLDGGKTGHGQVEDTRRAMTYMPRTEGGQAVLQGAGKLASFIPDFSGKAGDVVFDVTGSPVAAATAKSVVTALPELVGLATMRKLKAGTTLIDDLGNPTKELRKALDTRGLVYETLSPDAKAKIPMIADKSFITGQSLVSADVNKALVEQIKSGGRDDALSGIKVLGDRVVPDRLGLNAMKQGYSPGFVQSVKTMTMETKREAQKMLDIARGIKKKERLSLDVRPGNVVGDAVVKRIDYLRDSASDARRELNLIAKNKLPGMEIDTSIVRDKLTESLDDLKITVFEDKNGVPNLDFRGSAISKDRASQKAIKDAVDLLAEGGHPDALRAHELKRQLDSLIDFSKQSPRGLGREGHDVLRGLRASLNDTIRRVDPDYARVNDIMHKALTGLDDFDAATGAKVKIFEKGANAAIGTKMRGLMSNIDSRVNLENAVYQLDDIARDLSTRKGKSLMAQGSAGIKPVRPINLNDDIKDLVMFSNAMDARFGAVAKTSFQGNIEQAINRVLNQGVSQEIIQQGAGKIAKTANKLNGVNEFNAFEAMQELLKK